MYAFAAAISAGVLTIAQTAGRRPDERFIALLRDGHAAYTDTAAESARHAQVSNTFDPAAVDYSQIRKIRSFK